MEVDSRREYHEDEITLKELILKIQEYAREIIKNWFLIGLITFPVLGYFMYKHFTHVVIYKSELKFVVEGQKGTGGGLSSLLGSFGIKRGGGISPTKVLEVGKSSKLLHNILRDSIEDGRIIGDFIVAVYNKNDKWLDNNDIFSAYTFGNTISEKSQDHIATKTMKSLFWNPKNDSRYGDFEYDKKAGVFTINIETTNDTLSCAIANSIYDNLKMFFEHEILKRQEDAVNILKYKTDSLKNLGIQKAYQLARFSDSNNAIFYKEDKVKQSVLMNEIQAINAAYAELLKNYEMSDFNLKDIQPLFIDLEKPYLPLRGRGSSLFRRLLTGTVLGVFLGIVVVLLLKIYKEIMS